ncbi:MAG TPA: LysM domain-containing protein [Ilumatobacter sp.]|nr:LysM domain-containing protein [Ilumatobacter sp.]
MPAELIMRTSSRLFSIIAAAFVTLGVASCGDDYATSIDTLPPIRTTTTTLVPATTIDTNRYFYTIESGDNLNKIATKFCVPFSKLLELNSEVLPDPNNIPVDVQIELPAGMSVLGCVTETTAPGS